MISIPEHWLTLDGTQRTLVNHGEAVGRGIRGRGVGASNGGRHEVMVLACCDWAGLPQTKRGLISFGNVMYNPACA